MRSFTRCSVVAKTIKMSQLGSTLDNLVKDYGEKTEKQTNRAVRKTIIKIWGDIIKETPVQDGRARGNWFIDTKPTNQVGPENKRKGASYVSSETNKKDMLKGKWYLFNNLPYIKKLEYGGFTTKPETDKTVGGYSKLAPEGMVRKNLKYWGATLQKAFTSEGKKK